MTPLPVPPVRTYPIVLGTAGHIDHGKTSLVRALTGIDTDRLKVEKERGITTELGFAHLDLEDMRFGVVDVPGHERFIKSMVAGAVGLDLVCLVIAADEGVMPQTREHLDICQLLGVRRGVVALTKVDMVDADWLELVTEEVHSYLAASFLAEAALVPVSARTGAGLDDLRRELLRLCRAMPARAADGTFRLPLDRVFTIRGFGTVVTGTILGGQIQAGDQVIAHPRGIEAKVRGIEVHGESGATARAGMRCALNLSGVSRDDLRRGDLLAPPGALEPSHLIDARFRYLSSSRGPLGRRSRVLIHHATSQVMAALVLVDRERLEPGEEGLVQLHLDIATPLGALPGDHFIARGTVVQEHYGTTLGGGEVLRVHAPKLRRSSADASLVLHALAEADTDQRIALEVKTAGPAGRQLGQLVQRTGLARADIAAALARLVELGDLVTAGSGDTAAYCHAEAFAHLEEQALARLDEFHQSQPGDMSREELRARLPRALPPRLFDELVAALLRRGAIEAERDVVRRRRAGGGRADRAGPAPGLETDLAARFSAWGLTAPRPRDVPGEVGGDAGAVRAALDRLLAGGTLIKVKPDYYVDAAALAELRRRLLAHLDEHGQITPLEWKDIVGGSRKYSIPLAEHFDAEKVTLRVGEIRKRRG
ncbi:MAG TPA: selenocysteine-specific translation elongation factor [Kofleriaceae bacterium]|nr:selenocysteine-specific translation elongation factor [Kofleriaceae bacterium]